MKTLTTEMQLALFAAAGTAFAAVKRLDPPDPRALAAIGLLTAELAPTFEEYAALAAASGRPRPDPEEFAKMLAAAERFAGAVLEIGETQH